MDEKNREVDSGIKYEIAPGNVGRTGYGEVRGKLTSMYGADVETVSDFPKDASVLEKGAWYNYSLIDEIPSPVSASPEANLRLWQQMEVERMLDHQPTHEVHASDLPDYHYWPMIQRELDHKKIDDPTEMNDPTDIPRFFKTGVPKTPVQEQDFYLPLKEDGRFDWKRNIKENGYTASLFDKRGWDRRYLLALNKPTIPGHLSGIRQFAQFPIHFRQFELPLEKRFVRHFSASVLDRHLMVALLYCGGLASVTAGAANWKELNWDFEIGNYDMTFLKANRKQGGFHGLV